MSSTANNDEVSEFAHTIFRQTIEIMCSSLRQLAVTADSHPYLTPKLALIGAADAIEDASQKMTPDFSQRMSRH